MLPEPIRIRRRNAAGTREAILEAARLAFSHYGFDQVGVREITKAAGVNGSLVNRYFGSKEQLFAEAMQIGLGFDKFTAGGWSDLLAPLAHYASEKVMDRGHFDPILALIRSAPIVTAQPVLRAYIAREAVEPIAHLIGGEEAGERASLIVAFLIGVIILRTVIKSDPLASAEPEHLASMVEQMIDAAAKRPHLPVA